MLAPEWSSIRILGLLVLAVVHSGLTQNFYDINRVNKIELFFSEPNWDEILDSLYARGQGERLVGTALINGVRFDSVGVRYKGQSSYHPNRTKNPLNIRLDYIINNQLLDGSFGTLKLSNVYKDPSFVREVLSYEIARKYMAAGGANFTNLYINGQLIGLYTSTQDVDRFFTRTHFYSDEHPRFKGVVDLNIPQPTVWGYFGEDSTHYLDYYELESDSGWHDLINFLNTFNNNNSSVEAVLAVDRLLWMLAFDILMVNLDSPVNTGQNYYLYKSSSGQFNPIIWDLNENFGAYRLIAPGRFLSLIQMQRLDPLLNLSNPYYPIINKILSNPTYQRMYISHMKTIIAENFSNNWYKTRAIEIQQIIDSFVQADPNKFYTYNDFIKNITSTVGTGAQAIVGITELMDARVNFLLNHPALQGIPPFLSSPSWTPTRVYPNTTLWFSVRVDNAELVFLGYRQSKEDAFKKIRMYDDGNHNDGMAGDGIYGTFIKVGSGDIDYYIYAENSIAGRFLPERAEYEFYTIPLSGGKFLALENNIPNPFSHSTRFRYHIPFKSRVLLKIYDSAGREVKTLVDDQKEAGTYTVSLSAHSGLSKYGQRLTSGIYFAKLKLVPVNDEEIEYVGTTKFIFLR